MYGEGRGLDRAAEISGLICIISTSKYMQYVLVALLQLKWLDTIQVDLFVEGIWLTSPFRVSTYLENPNWGGRNKVGEFFGWSGKNGVCEPSYAIVVVTRNREKRQQTGNADTYNT